MVPWKKTAKSYLLQPFSRQLLLEVPLTYVSFVDKWLIWTLAFPTFDNRDLKTRSWTDYLWCDYLNKVSSMVYSRHNNTTIIILINNNYTILRSIKDGKQSVKQKHTRISLKFAKRSTIIPHFFPIQTNHGKIGKQSSITDVFKAAIQIICLSSVRWINLMWRKCCQEFS